MNFIQRFYQSSIGKKWVVALTALPLVGYVVGHMLGNLQIFIGPAQINAYAEFLHSHEIALWFIRAFLIAAFALHITATIQLTIQNRRARPERYAFKSERATTFASRTMIVSGLILLCFVIFHLLHFTTRSTDSRFKPIADGGMLHGEFDVYTMVILGFRNPLASGFYVVGMFLLCMHLSHGAQSFLQTLGLNNKRLLSTLLIASRVFGWAIFAGYTVIPAAVLIGFLKPPAP
jgi:succinate dehydrogenase cytochrome b subunit